MKRIKRVLSVLLLFVVVMSIGYTNSVSQVEKPKDVQSVSVLGYVSDPWPGYNISYAPSYYDPNVVKIQNKLNSMGDMFYCGTADGYFGSKTLEAVKNFQWNEGLTVDGIVGQITWNKLFYIYN